MPEQCQSMLCKGRAKRAYPYLQAMFQPKHFHNTCYIITYDRNLPCISYFLFIYGASYVNVLQLLMFAGYTIFMNMSLLNS